MENLQNKLIKNLQHNNQTFKLFPKEKGHEVNSIFSSAFHQELQLLVRGEFDDLYLDKNVVLFFFDLNTKELKGK